MANNIQYRKTKDVILGFKQHYSYPEQHPLCFIQEPIMNKLLKVIRKLIVLQPL